MVSDDYYHFMYCLDNKWHRSWLCSWEVGMMTRREAAMVLVNMASQLASKGNLDYSSKRQLNEAVVMACGELMVEEVLNERLKCEVEECE